MNALIAFWLAQDGATKLPEATQRALESGPSFADAMSRMLWMLGITVLVLLLGARFLPKWLGVSARPKSRGLIRIVETQVLEPRKSIYLVQVVDQFFLLGTSDQRIEVLAGGDLEPETLARLSEIAKEPAPATDFLNRITRSSAAAKRSTSEAEAP